MKNNEKTLSIVLKIFGTFLLTILVVILGLFGNISFGDYTISFVCIPIIIGATLCGTASGTWLGLVFGVTQLIAFFTSGRFDYWQSINTFGAIITILLRGILAGVLSGLFYKILDKIHYSIATIVAGIICPLVNTGVYLIGLKLFFDVYGVFVLSTYSVSNFIIEILINLVIASIFVIIIKTVLKLISKNKKTDNYIHTIPDDKITANKLLEYKELLDIGIITQEEFNAKKNELLGNSINDTF